MTDRNMQAKTHKAALQRAAVALDIKDRESYIARTAPTVTLTDIKAAYTGRVTVCPAGKYNGFQSRVSKTGSGSQHTKVSHRTGQAIRAAQQAVTTAAIRAARAASPTF